MERTTAVRLTFFHVDVHADLVRTTSLLESRALAPPFGPKGALVPYRALWGPFGPEGPSCLWRSRKHSFVQLWGTITDIVFFVKVGPGARSSVVTAMYPGAQPQHSMSELNVLLRQALPWVLEDFL